MIRYVVFEQLPFDGGEIAPVAVHDTEDEARQVVARRTPLVRPNVPGFSGGPRSEWEIPAYAIEPIETPDPPTPTCPTCAATALKECGMETTMGWHPYLDAAGALHAHDPNTRTTHYRCPSGHTFSLQSHDPCPSCEHGKT